MLNSPNYLWPWPNSNWRAGGSDSSGEPGYTAGGFAPAQNPVALGRPKGSPVPTGRAWRSQSQALHGGAGQEDNRHKLKHERFR